MGALLVLTVPRTGIVGAAWSVTVAHVVNLLAGLAWLVLRTGPRAGPVW
jgi:Na+-driven multidrug efflux pump